jgi:hypothetical protein
MCGTGTGTITVQKLFENRKWRFFIKVKNQYTYQAIVKVLMVVTFGISVSLGNKIPRVIHDEIQLTFVSSFGFFLNLSVS